MHTMSTDEPVGEEKTEKVTTVSTENSRLKLFKARVNHVREMLSEAPDPETVMDIKEDLLRTAKSEWSDDYEGMRIFIVGESSRVADEKRLQRQKSVK